MDTTKISRVEVVNHCSHRTEEDRGRVYVYWDAKDRSDIQLSLQDEGRTLKVFIRDKKANE